MVAILSRPQCVKTWRVCIIRGMCWSKIIMMTSSNGNIFHVTGPLCGEFTGWPVNSPHKWPVTRSYDVFFDLRPNKRLSNRCEVGDLRRNRAHYGVINKLTLTSRLATTHFLAWHLIMQYIETEAKWPLFHRGHFEMHFLEWTYHNFV